MIEVPFNRAEYVLYAAYNGRTTMVYQVNMADLEIEEFDIKKLSNKRLPPGHQILQMPVLDDRMLQEDLRDSRRFK